MCSINRYRPSSRRIGNSCRILYSIILVSSDSEHVSGNICKYMDVDWIKGTIVVRRQIQDIPVKGPLSGAPKTRSGNRTILLGETTLYELRNQKQRTETVKDKAGDNWRENDLIFPSQVSTPFGTMSLSRVFVKVLQAANLPKIRFHDLRHTAASLMLSHGIPALVVSNILGHSNPSITLSIYAHSTLDMQDTAVGVMDEIVTPIPVSMPNGEVSLPFRKE